MGLRSVKIKRVKRVVKYSLIALIVTALAITAALVPYRLLLPAVAIPERAKGEMRVHFLDVGQGDCTIVEFPSGDALVVDAGANVLVAGSAVFGKPDRAAAIAGIRMAADVKP